MKNDSFDNYFDIPDSFKSFTIHIQNHINRFDHIEWNDFKYISNRLLPANFSLSDYVVYNLIVWFLTWKGYLKK